MIHEMRLHYQPFYEMKMGRKKKEMRLNDEKRRKVNIGDFIVFKLRPECQESIKMKVLGIKKYGNYHELLESNPDMKNQGIDSYYPKEIVDKYGLILFDLKLEK